MAVVGNALLDRFIGHSEAEQAFQPWWDITEDFLVYGLIMLGSNFIYYIKHLIRKYITKIQYGDT